MVDFLENIYLNNLIKTIEKLLYDQSNQIGIFKPKNSGPVGYRSNPQF